MKANELRIGNLLMWEDESHDIVTVTAINVENVNEYIATSNNEQAQLEEFIPIPLTEEWIWKFGFEDRGELYNFNIDPAISLQLIPSEGIESLFYPAIVNYPELSFESESTVHLNSIRYVHQLQNLYFALTGEESMINFDRMKNKITALDRDITQNPCYVPFFFTNFN